MVSEIKICGLSTRETLDAAVASGATMVGFVFFDRSPRAVTLGEAAALAGRTCGKAGIVALTVDSPDDVLARIAEDLRPDLVQLHGKETPERAAEIRSRFAVRVMKAVGVAGAEDLAGARAYEGAVDALLLDAKPPKDADRPGGNGAAFDWRILDGFAPAVPWLLSGGLSPANVADALAASRPTGIDVSSGVESAPGVKDPRLIRAFIDAVRAAGRPRPARAA
ncbi:phosphoribosylanthranilate isomerase [Propylenella binzhouense]|uniref:N-(5'-phosphoribosyl)anthranilate isomerase n=1 Tax=Propylenella binzhouense TaxID=2555902 RepID=A0A964WVG6_9HYPH|nr:phosphoribosylanthranilate isomerase [Propylenella binzhouense]MYZ50212.1 phosphoribosylanthranilate isomerase [Propylenella binzhouense]